MRRTRGLAGAAVVVAALAVAASALAAAGDSIMPPESRSGRRLLTAPAYGVQVDAPPRLRWARVPGARFYDVHLYQSGQKLLSSWPRGRSLELRPNWHFNGRRRALRPGRIHWFVWPAFGTRANPQYGAQLGASAFVVPGNACTASLQSPSC